MENFTIKLKSYFPQFPLFYAIVSLQAIGGIIRMRKILVFNKKIPIFVGIKAKLFNRLKMENIF